MSLSKIAQIANELQETLSIDITAQQALIIAQYIYYRNDKIKGGNNEKEH